MSKKFEELPKNLQEASEKIKTDTGLQSVFSATSSFTVIMAMEAILNLPHLNERGRKAFINSIEYFLKIAKESVAKGESVSSTKSFSGKSFEEEMKESLGKKRKEDPASAEIADDLNLLKAKWDDKTCKGVIKKIENYKGEEAIVNNIKTLLVEFKEDDQKSFIKAITGYTTPAEFPF